MGKLVYQDEQGNSHDIEMAHVSTKNLKEGDIVSVSYEVGTATQKDVIFALERLKSIFDNILPKGVKHLIFATRGGKKDVEYKIIKDKTQHIEE